MELPLDKILEINGFSDLKPRKGEIQRTIDAMLLQEGKEYLSIGIGKNRFPLIVALLGLKVTGLDNAEKSLDYQITLLQGFYPYLQKACGTLKVSKVDI